MEALHSHLKPLPANHHHAHTTIRILGKLGGRNRRLLTKEPAFKYHHYSKPATVCFVSGSSFDNIALGPISILASQTIRKVNPPIILPYRPDAYKYLVSCLKVLVHEVRSIYFQEIRLLG
jgi:transformation/transcription domain-associated protein